MARQRVQPIAVAKIEPGDTIDRAEAHGRALAGLRAWLANRSKLPESLVAATEALALGVDARPDDAALWGRYQRSLEALCTAAAEGERERERQWSDLRTEFASYEVVETYRFARYRELLDAGDEIEARRWERLVPIGCARGEHRWHTWPAGLVECGDCCAEPVDA